MSTIVTDNFSNIAGTKTTSVANVVDGAAKAWVNFNGTGTVTIRKAFNVTSITDNGVGDYTINFTTQMPDTNYAAVAMSNWDGTSRGSLIGVNTLRTKTTSSVPITTQQPAPYVLMDVSDVNVVIYG